MSTIKVRSSASQQNADVRYSDRGYAYAERGQSGDIQGIVNFGPTSIRPTLTQVPRGVFFYNTDTNCLELSDPENNQWICLQAGSGIAGLIGLPSDGSFDDGAVIISPSGTVADAVDSINEYLVGCCVSGNYASHLGTTDGNTNGFLQDPSFLLGRVSTPTTSGNPFYTGGWNTDSNRDITNSNSVTWQLQASQKITDLQTGTITVSYIDGNLNTLHTETLTPDGSLNNQSSSPNSYVSITNLEQHLDRVEGFISINVPGNVVLSGSSGYLQVLAQHVVSTTTYDQSLEFFLDKEAAPSVGTQGVALGFVFRKYLSGVAFATIIGSSRSELVFSNSLLNVWKDTYRADPLLVNSSDFGITNFTVPYNSSSVTKNAVSPPAAPFIHNEDFVYSQSVEIISTSVINPDQNGNFSSINYQVRDPFNVVNGTPIVPLILINTYPNQSTDVLELFLDEDYRLIPNSGTSALSSINGSGRASLAWDSTQSLAISGGLQVINGALIYPQTDYSSYAPLPNPDYSSLPGSLGNEIYVRRFRDSLGASRSNGLFLITGMTEADRTSGDILIDLRVVGPHISGNGTQGPGNTGTGWLSLNTSFNSGTFKGDDGDGCFVTVGGFSAPNFEFTLGGFSTGFAGNQAIEVRVTYKNPQALSDRIRRIEITNWN